MHDRYKQNRVHIFAPRAERKHLKAHCGPRHGAGPRRHRLFGRYRARRAVFPRRGADCRSPIMCFSSRWATRTRQNLKKYLLRLFIAAVISHVPYALCFKFTVWEFWYVTGVLWGLFWGFSPSRCGNGCAHPFGCGCFCSGCAACSPTPQTGITSPCCGSSALPSFGKAPKSNGRFSGSSRFCMFCSISSTALRCPCG